MKTEAFIKELKKGNTDKIKKFFEENSVDLNSFDKKSGKNIVQLTIESQQPQIFQQLISKPTINFNLTDQKGQQTILQTAILFNNQQFVEKILQKHANPNLSNSKGYNSLHTAVMENLPRMIQILLKTKLEINLKCKEGNIINLAIINERIEVALWIFQNEYLMSKLDLTAKDNQGNNCLLLATQRNMTQIVAEIINKLKKSKLSSVQKELFINCQNKQGDTALHIAYRQQFQTILQLLEQNESELGLNKLLKNLKGETFKQIIAKKEVVKQNQLKNQQKIKEQKKIKQKEKQQEKIRQAQRLIQQQKIKKEKIRLLLQQTQAQRQQEAKNTRIKFLIGFIIIVFIFYAIFHYGIQKKKQAMPTI